MTADAATRRIVLGVHRQAAVMDELAEAMALLRRIVTPPTGAPR